MLPKLPRKDEEGGCRGAERVAVSGGEEPRTESNSPRVGGGGSLAQILTEGRIQETER